MIIFNYKKLKKNKVSKINNNIALQSNASQIPSDKKIQITFRKLTIIFTIRKSKNSMRTIDINVK